jgi:hypothetical protein
LLELICVQAGHLAQIYGKIKNGKTYFATMMAIETANSGQVVYVNWPIEWSGYDERAYWKYRFLALLGLKKRFLSFPKENMRFADLSDLENVKVDGVLIGKNFYDWVGSLTTCTCFFDEGHIYYDSYMALKMEMKRRLPILETGHYDRTIYVISQRAGAIHAVLRGNVNVFYKVEKTYEGWFGVRFRRVEFQETGPDEKPNEERETFVDTSNGHKTYGDYLYAESIRKYWGRKRVFSVYNSKYRRLGAKESQLNLASVYRVSWLDNLRNIFKLKLK